MRQTEYRRKSRAISDAISANVQSVVQAELNWLARQVVYKIRRINQFRPRVGMERPKLRKAYVVSGDLWEMFRRRMHSAVMKALISGVITLADLNRIMYSTDTPIEFDSESFAVLIEPLVGERITKVTSTIKRNVGRKVVAWYNSPGSTMQSLVDQIKKENFGESRARLIAQNEVTYLNSQVKLRVAQQIGADEWWWSTRNDQIVCKHDLIGPDGKTYKGCRGLHGKTFKIGMPMPPEGSHIGCRCDPVIIPRIPVKPQQPTAVIEGLMIQKADFVENEHPRDEDGKFTDKGMGTSGGGSEGKERNAGGFEFLGWDSKLTEKEFQEKYKDNYLFHTTNKENLDSIVENGLIGGRGTNYDGYKTSDVALATNAEEADYFASLLDARYKDEGKSYDPVILRVKVSDTSAKPYRWHQNEVRSGNINPENLEVWDGEIWKPLKLLKADFREDQHPRKKDGKFAPKGMGEAGGSKEEHAPKQERTQEKLHAPLVLSANPDIDDLPEVQKFRQEHYAKATEKIMKFGAAAGMHYNEFKDLLVEYSNQVKKGVPPQQAYKEYLKGAHGIMAGRVDANDLLRLENSIRVADWRYIKNFAGQKPIPPVKPVPTDKVVDKDKKVSPNGEIIAKEIINYANQKQGEANKILSELRERVKELEKEYIKYKELGVHGDIIGHSYIKWVNAESELYKKEVQYSVEVNQMASKRIKTGEKRDIRFRNEDELEKDRQKALDALEIIGDYVSPSVKLKVEAVTFHRTGSKRPYYSPKSHMIALQQGAHHKDVFHEWGHHLEWNNEGAKQAVTDFMKRRTAGEKTVPLSEADKKGRYRPEEMCKPDKFIEPYVGKIYDGGSTEILSVGLSYYINDPVNFAKKDPEHFALIYDICHGKYEKEKRVAK